MTSLYHLQPVVENPAYEGFYSTQLGSKTPAALKFNTMQVLEAKQYKPRPLLADWKPVKVAGRVRTFNDYPAAGRVPIFSERAVEALSDFLEPNGELLPLDSELGSYYAYNTLTVADVLDQAKSQIHWVVPGKLSTIVDRYEVIPERLDGLAIFLLPYLTDRPLVTDAFVNRVREAGLKGMVFVKVWPLPANVSWVDMQKQAQRTMETEGLPKGQTAMGNAVFLRFPLSNPSSDTPTPLEQQRIDRYHKELDQMLTDPGSTAPPVGALDAREVVGGEARFDLSCPNSDALVKRLLPWLRQLDWSGKPRVIKHYGYFADPDAQEEEVFI